MSKTLKTIAVVAGAVALIATGIGAAAGIGLIAVSAGTLATAATVAAVASAVSAAAMAGSTALMKPPDMKGSINQVLVGNNLPVPYCMGRSYSGGAEVYSDSAGDKNKDWTKVYAYTVAGPIDGFEKFNGDYSPLTFPTESGGLISGNVNGYYNDFLFVNSRLGARPDTALTPASGRAAFRGWGASHKLSGIASASATMVFDKKGKRWSGGLPQWGMVAKWVKVYDPRLDGTYPGGVGTHRWADEGTWAWSENPALHALAYARGRFVNGVKVAGAGIAQEAINIPRFVELANICDTNDWTIGGTVYEGPGISKWDNLKRILIVAAAEPVWIGGTLDLHITTPRVALDTITIDDVIGNIDVTAMTGWKDRINTIVPRVRLETHAWEYEQLEAIDSATYITEDGETKTEEFQFDLCQDKDQGAELAALMLVNRREFGPIEVQVKPRLMGYVPGEALELDLPEAGLVDQLAIIQSRQVDPGTGVVTLTLRSETTAKHAFALGRTGVAPPTPSLWTPEQIDDIASQLEDATVVGLISTSVPIDEDPVTPLLTATDTTISIEDHLRRYDDLEVAVLSASGDSIDTEAGDNLLTEAGATILLDSAAPVLTGLTPLTQYHVYYDDFDRLGGAVTFLATTDPRDAVNRPDTTPGRHYVGSITTDTAGGTGTSDGGASPPTWDGDRYSSI